MSRIEAVLDTELTAALRALPAGHSDAREHILTALKILHPRLHKLCAAVEYAARCAACRDATDGVPRSP